MSQIDVLLFDLGGVLVDFSGVRDLAVLLGGRLSESEILERMGRYPPSEQFGLGKLSREDFANHFVKDWNLELPPQDFLREYQSWSRCLYPGAVELLTLLRPRFRLAVLSNSNELHWERNTNELGVTGLFDIAWMDGCPVLADLRTDPRFIALRTTVAARARAIVEAFLRAT